MSDQPHYDVFLAHNNQDKPQVRAVAKELRQRGLNPWLDEDVIAPGRWFQDALQQAIPDVKSAAIFIGPGGLGKWQAVELRTFISQCVEADISVIPVLLPDVDKLPTHLLFLSQLNWVRFTSGIDDVKALDNLEWGITGLKPELRINYSEEFRQNYSNNKQPTSSSSSPAPSVSINPFNQPAKLVTGGVILVISLAAGLSFYHKPDKNPTLTTSDKSGYVTGNIACYSHNKEESIRSVGDGIYLMGLIKLTGKYKGRIFEPKGYEGQDVSAAQELKDLCNQTFPSSKGDGWAGGDTGGFVGIEPISL